MWQHVANPAVPAAGTGQAAEGPCTAARALMHADRRTCGGHACTTSADIHCKLNSFTQEFGNPVTTAIKKNITAPHIRVTHPTPAPRRAISLTSRGKGITSTNPHVSTCVHQPATAALPPANDDGYVPSLAVQRCRSALPFSLAVSAPIPSPPHPLSTRRHHPPHSPSGTRERGNSITVLVRQQQRSVRA